ncbi:MAG: Major Facilitator Superfamily protein [Candidatus Omnitrophica bacterium ADurb.Bin277]|nr:MAG: Major Facilitator Superfamily protein [Candidatus Omnitrophica bacterium ADurb.Bin277]
MLSALKKFKNNRYFKSLNLSWKEGIPASAMQSMVDEYLIPLGLFLGATPWEIGLLVAIPNLFGSCAQFFAVRIVKVLGSRLRCLATGAVLQVAFLVPIACLAPIGMPKRISLLIFFITMFRIIGGLIGTIWGSLTSDYLRPEERGFYFGWRSRITGLAGVFGIILGGVLLFSFREISPALGFFILFALAAAARTVSAWLMAQMEDIPQGKNPGDEFTFLMFLRRFRESNFVKFVLYVASITFTTNLAAPFFSVYMLRDLQFNYLVFMFVHLGAVAAGLFSFPVWGKHADAIGNARILKLTSFLIPVIPILWMFSSNLVYLFTIEIFAGFVWGGFNLCSLNFIYDAVSPGKRIRCIGYFTFINGVAMFLGALLGGYLVERIPPIQGSRILSIFLVSGILRFASHFILSKHFHEVRETGQKVSSAELFFSVVGIRPVLGQGRDWGFLGTLRKFPRED